MKKLQSSLTNMVLVLTLITVIAATILAYVNSITKGPIDERAEKALATGIKTVLNDPNLKVVKTDSVGEKFIVYTTQKANGEYLGVAVQSEVIGFGGPLQILVGFDKADAIVGYTVLKHSETPGLGSNANTWFQKGAKGSIIGMVPSTPLMVTKDGGTVDAITASTITSRAFLKAVNLAYQAYKELHTAGADTMTSTDSKTGATMSAKTTTVMNKKGVKGDE